MFFKHSLYRIIAFALLLPLTSTPVSADIIPEIPIDENIRRRCEQFEGGTWKPVDDNYADCDFGNRMVVNLNDVDDREWGKQCPPNFSLFPVSLQSYCVESQPLDTSVLDAKKKQFQQMIKEQNKADRIHQEQTCNAVAGMGLEPELFNKMYPFCK